jgi:hypothetical protein
MSSVISEARSHVLVAVVIVAALCCPESYGQIVSSFVETQQLVDGVEGSMYGPEDILQGKGKYQFVNSGLSSVWFLARARIENDEGDPLTDWSEVQVQVAALSTHTGGWIVSPEEELSEAPDFVYYCHLEIWWFWVQEDQWVEETSADRKLQFWYGGR